MKFHALLLPVTACLSFAQTPAPLASFEAASVQPVSAFAFQVARPVINGNRYEYKSANTVDFVANAYNVDPERVLGGPMWVEYDRYDIIGRIPPDTSPEKVKEMLQSVLVSRFGLVTKRETRMLPALALTVPKRHQLKPTGGSARGCRFLVNAVPAGEGAQVTAECHNMTIAAFAEQLRGFPGFRGLTTNPIQDQTELTGAWDFTVNLPLPMNGASTPLSQISGAFESQLGLRLESVQAPFPAIVIEKVNRVPTPNPPGVTESLKPKAPPEFEVAQIKPSDPSNRRLGVQFPPGGRGGQVTINGMTLSFLIQQAWGLKPDKVVGGPKWMAEDRFDLVAKLPTDPKTGALVVTAIEGVWPMLRALLAERFKLATHFEEQPGTAYKLVAVKPKLTPGDPTQRTKCAEGPGADGKDPRKTNPILSHLVTCRNVTMDQFSLLLQNMGYDVLINPVENATHPEGIWDFTLNFSPWQATQNGSVRSGNQVVFISRGGGSPAGTSDEASAPSGAITIFDAIEKQLGLKLEMQKRPVQVLVIDHVEQKPTDN